MELAPENQGPLGEILRYDHFRAISHQPVTMALCGFTDLKSLKFSSLGEVAIENLAEEGQLSQLPYAAIHCHCQALLAKQTGRRCQVAKSILPTSWRTSPEALPLLACLKPCADRRLFETCLTELHRQGDDGVHNRCINALLQSRSKTFSARLSAPFLCGKVMKGVCLTVRTGSENI